MHRVNFFVVALWQHLTCNVLRKCSLLAAGITLKCSACVGRRKGEGADESFKKSWIHVKPKCRDQRPACLVGLVICLRAQLVLWLGHDSTTHYPPLLTGPEASASVAIWHPSRLAPSAAISRPQLCARPWVIQGGSPSLAKPCVAGTHTCVCECMYVCVCVCVSVHVSPGNKTGFIILRTEASKLQLKYRLLV